MQQIILPYRGEFGHKIMTYVPTIHGFDSPKKIVCCEPGEECLYPSATKIIIVDRMLDKNRREKMHHDENFHEELTATLRKDYPKAEIKKSFNRKKKYFIPKPTETNNISCDVVICPRYRKYGVAKNWKLWKELDVELSKKYKVFAAGAADSSGEIVSPASWSYERFLDASIEGMLSSKVVIATDTGLGYLALLCGKPLILISSDGKTCPSYKKISLKRFQGVNHMKMNIDIVDAWTDIKNILISVDKEFQNENK